MAISILPVLIVTFHSLGQHTSLWWDSRPPPWMDHHPKNTFPQHLKCLSLVFKEKYNFNFPRREEYPPLSTSAARHSKLSCTDSDLAAAVCRHTAADLPDVSRICAGIHNKADWDWDWANDYVSLKCQNYQLAFSFRLLRRYPGDMRHETDWSTVLCSLLIMSQVQIRKPTIPVHWTSNVKIW